MPKRAQSSCNNRRAWAVQSGTTGGETRKGERAINRPTKEQFRQWLENLPDESKAGDTLTNKSTPLAKCYREMNGGQPMFIAGLYIGIAENKTEFDFRFQHDECSRLEKWEQAFMDCIPHKGHAGFDIRETITKQESITVIDSI